MKKYIPLLLILLFAFAQIETAEAQFRPFLEPIAGNEDEPNNPNTPRPPRNPGSPGNQPLVDPFGNPMPGCCENPSNGWEFNLSFGSFSILSQLQSQIAAERAYRDQMIRWLRQQENTTLLNEINRQMRTNHTSFATAQRAYFKFYDGGGNGNGGVVARARELSIRESQRQKSWRDKRDKYLVEVVALDSWINCGFCEEYAGLVINAADGRARADAPNVRRITADNFGDANYLNGFHESRSKGIYKIIDNGVLLDRLSSIRVNQYRSLGWEERVLQMSAYLVNYNLRGSCSILTGGNCLPSSLAPYRPNQLWNDPTIEAWGKEFAPAISNDQLIFSDEYVQNVINAAASGFGPFGQLGPGYAANYFEQERKRVLEELKDELGLTEEFSKWILSVGKNSGTPCGIGHDCVKSISTMAEGLRKFHGEEGALMANYFDSLTADFNSFSLADLQEFYDLAKAVTDRYNEYMFSAVTGAFAQGTAQILGVILFEIGGNAAIQLLQKIPIGWVFRGLRLNNMVKNVGLLGKQGFNNTIREVITSSPVTKARTLFNSLTKRKPPKQMVLLLLTWEMVTL